MAKKGIQLQIDCETEEDWAALVTNREGLIVCDVYSDWCGPCNGMSANLKKLKLEFGGDTLTIATAKCDNIKCLERFRGKSEPTWMFISGGKTIRLLFGANAPRLMHVIMEEIKLERKYATDHTPRNGIEFYELTNEEQARVDEEERLKEEMETYEREQRELQVKKHREAVAQNLLEPLKEYIFALMWPHITIEQQAKLFELIKEINLSVGGKPTRKKLTEEEINEMFYYVDYEIEPEAIEILKNEEAIALCFVGMPTEEDILQNMLGKIYGEMRGPPGSEGSFADKVKTNKVVKPKAEEENFSKMDEEEVTIPGVYVPPNNKAKVLGLRILFPMVTVKFDLPEPEPVPPLILVAFDAFKRNEVLQLAVEYPVETMKMGFFTGTDPETAELICKTPEQFNKIPVPPVEAKLIIQVSKKKSEPLLSYSILGPVYVSPHPEQGKKECNAFFPEGYDEPEPEVIEEEVKIKRKKKKASSKTSVASEYSEILSEITLIDETGEDEDDRLSGIDEDIYDDMSGSMISGYDPSITSEFIEGADKSTSPSAPE